MSNVKVILKKDGNKWVLETEKGLRLSYCNKKHEADAYEWAKKYIIPWYDWEVVLEKDYKKETEDEKKSRMPGQVIQSPKVQN